MFQSNISSSFEPESSSRKSSPMSPAPRQTRNLGRDHGYDVALPKVVSSKPTSRQSVNTDSQRLSHLSSSLPVVRTSRDHSHSLREELSEQNLVRIRKKERTCWQILVGCVTQVFGGVDKILGKNWSRVFSTSLFSSVLFSSLDLSIVHNLCTNWLWRYTCTRSQYSFIWAAKGLSHQTPRTKGYVIIIFF